MASKESNKSLQESDFEDSVSIRGFWSESESADQSDWVTESCVAVVEPSKDESRDSDGNPKPLFDEFFMLSCPEILTDEASADAESSKDEARKHSHSKHQNSKHQNSKHQNSNQEQTYPKRNKEQMEHNGNNQQMERNINDQQIEHSNNDQQMEHSNNDQQLDHNIDQELAEHNINQEQMEQNINEERTDHSSNEQQNDVSRANCWATFLDCYNINSRKVKDSWFIYIFQFFVSLLSVSEIVMGIIYFPSCDPHPSFIPINSILMGIFGLALTFFWLRKVRIHRRGEHCWNLERNILSVLSFVFFLLLTVEVIGFFRISPKTIQTDVETKCIKTYFDYLYYMHFPIAGSVFIAASLYLPDCCIYCSTYQPPVPSNTNGHYQPI